MAQSGTYTVTVTGANTCTATVTTSVSFIGCLTISGAIFDDANGNGMAGANDTMTTHGFTMYAVLADTNGLVVKSSSVASNGSFSFSNVLPSTAGMSVRISTTNPSAGANAPAASWPANWYGTKGQYGTNNAMGTGVFASAAGKMPIATGTQSISGLSIGYDRVAAPVSQTYTIPYPGHNSIKALTTTAGLGKIAWADPEDGLNTGTFVVISVTNMHSNTLFYDSNGNNIAEATEIITGYRAISGFKDTLLKVKFTGLGSTTAQFSYAYIDLAGQTKGTPSTYNINWTGGALPVKLEFFTADKRDEHSSLLKWETASEINNDHFEVERSADAISWSKIGQVQGAGNSNQTLDYSLVDESPLPGINYYRLKQVDVDGHFEYSEVATVEFGDASEAALTVMTVYPNPVKKGGGLNIALAGSADAIKHIVITNEIGQEVFSYDPANEQGYRIPALNLAAGVYIVNVLSTSNQKFSSKIVMQ